MLTSAFLSLEKFRPASLPPMSLLVEIEKLRPHELALLVPAARPEEFAALLADIARAGIREPLVVIPDEDPDEFLIVDGVHRYRAAKELGLRRVPIVVRRMSEEEILDFVLSAAVCRRSLSEDQRAALAARVLPDEPLQMEIREAAVRFGTTTPRVKKALLLKQKSERLFESVVAGDLTIAAAFEVLSFSPERKIHPWVEEMELPSRLKEHLAKIPYELQPFVAAEMASLLELSPLTVSTRPEVIEALSEKDGLVSDLTERELRAKSALEKTRREKKQLERVAKKLYVALKKTASKSDALHELDGKTDPLPAGVVSEGLEKIEESLEVLEELQTVEPKKAEVDPEDAHLTARLERALHFLLAGFEEENVSEILVLLKRGKLSDRGERLLFSFLERNERFLRSLKTLFVEKSLHGTSSGKKRRRFLVITEEDENDEGP